MKVSTHVAARMLMLAAVPPYMHVLSKHLQTDGRGKFRAVVSSHMCT